ncbi:MAG: DNA repair protein RecN [Rhodocyclaceae bacterium]
MLHRLLIRDFVIVDTLELEFPDGFGALTGETGAGKSILVDALALALGERADPAVVRVGCARAEISAEFELTRDESVMAWLGSNDFSCEERQCLLRRVVEAGGRSRGYINGAPATAAQMRELGEMLVDIHGQHAHHALLRAEAQRGLLDAHGGLVDLQREVAERYRSWRHLADARRNAERDTEGMAREREMLEWQLGELRELAFDSRQWEELGVEHRRLANAANLLAGGAQALASLEEGEFALVATAGQVAQRLGSLGEYDPELREAADLLEDARIRLDEAAHLLRRHGEKLELDPQRLVDVEARLEAVHQMARKHRVVPADLPEIQLAIERRLDQLQGASDPALLARREEESKAAFFTLAADLSTGRADTAARLSRAVTDAMQGLAMEGGVFEVALQPHAEGTAHGLEDIEFRVSANPNQPLRPLAKVASGGELSRIGLAIQVIASAGGAAGTLIFDEVDVGIGGRVAEIVGRMLRGIGVERQVLCVTHLPQVAAQANWQWAIAKRDGGEGVTSSVTALDDQTRVEEIARMLGGVAVTATTRRHARELLAAGRG